MHETFTLFRVAVAVLPAALVAGCAAPATVENDPRAQVSTLEQTGSCHHLGTSQLKLSGKAKLLIRKDDDKAARALLEKARVLADEIGADTVVPTGEVTDGERVFRFYICGEV